MTVVSALITKYCTAHASDSLITVLRADGTREVTEWKKPKLIHVRPFRGVLAYWGLAQHGEWSTLSWLREQAQNASKYNSPEKFAHVLATELNHVLHGRTFVRLLDKGIGIHFTAYERVRDYWIPELFLVSNWQDPSYSAIRPEGVGVTRETFHTLMQEPPVAEHGQHLFRMRVHQALQAGAILGYNNGDPILFNTVANSMFRTVEELRRRGSVKAIEDSKSHCDLARRPIEVISRMLSDFCKTDMRAIGGKPHDMSVTPDGQCWSSTGDCTE